MSATMMADVETSRRVLLTALDVMKRFSNGLSSEHYPRYVVRTGGSYAGTSGACKDGPDDIRLAGVRAEFTGSKRSTARRQ